MPQNYNLEKNEYLLDKGRYAGFTRMMWLNTFAPRAKEYFSTSDRVLFDFFKRAVHPNFKRAARLEIMEKSALFRLLHALPLSEKEKLFYVKRKGKARRDMASSNRELVAQANLLEGKATRDDIAVLDGAKFQNKYGVLDIDALRQVAVAENIVGFSDNLKTLSAIVDTAEKNADKIQAIKVINEMMNFTASSSKQKDKQQMPLQELSGFTDEQIQAMITKLTDGEKIE
jgi:hypothetical protein